MTIVFTKLSPRSIGFYQAATVVIMACGLAVPAAAQTVWINPATGSWFDDVNWSDGQPDASTDADVNNGGTARLTGTRTGQADTLTVDAPSNVELFTNSTLILSNSNGTGSITLEGGTLEARPGGGPTFGAGIVATSSGGTIESSDDQVTISGVISGGVGSILTIHDSGNSFFAIFLSGQNTIAGQLVIDHAAVIAAAQNVYGLGTVFITPTGAADLGGYNQHIHDLEGSGFFVNRNVASAPGSTRTNVLNVDMGNYGGVIRDSSTSYGGGVVSQGIVSLVKATSDTLTLSGISTYSGPTEVQGGALIVDGSITSAATVDSGATLGGQGTVGTLDLLGGATLSPGFVTPYQTLRITGNATFAANSIFQVHINPAGQTDSVTIGGTATINGGSVSVLPANGAYPATRYTILTAQGGRTGQFAAVQSSMAFLTPTLSYDPTHVYIDVAQTAPMSSAAITTNQGGVAGAVQSLGPGNPVYDAVITQTAQGAQQAFTALSGVAHADVPTIAVQDGRSVIGAVFDRLWNVPVDGGGDALSAIGQFGTVTSPALLRCYDEVSSVNSGAPTSYDAWGQALGDFGRNSGDGNAPSVSRGLGGFATGIDRKADFGRLGQWRLGVGGGYTNDSFSSGQGTGRGTFENAFGTVYAGARYGMIDVRLGASYGDTTTTVRRTVAFPGFFEGEHSSYGGNVAQGFGEFGYRIALPRAILEPILDGGVTHVDQDRYREKGGAAALVGFAEHTDVEFTTLGFRGEVTPFTTLPLVARLMLGWEHSYGDLEPASTLAFASGSAKFQSFGTPLDRNAALGETAVVYKASDTVALTLAYAGQIGRRDRDNSVRGRLDYKF